MFKSLNGPSHEILVLITYAQKSHLNANIDVSRKVRSPHFALTFIYIHTMCVRVLKALGSLLLFAGSPEHLLLHNAISWLIEYSY